MMSSETSTETTAAEAAPTREASLDPWQLFAVAGLLGATVVVFVSRGQSPAAVVLLSLAVFASAAVGAAALRVFLPLATGRAWLSTAVVGGRTRVALEREKALALRTIKELEFDRAMGKVSDHDFAEMSARLRARAGRLLRQLDAGVDYRQQIEREIAQRLGPAPAPAAGACAGCGTANDPDARFCKSCGRRLQA